MFSRKELSETDICDQYITPALRQAGWDHGSQIRREYSITAGRIIVRGKMYKRGKQKRADYVLFYTPDIPIAIIEAKDNNHSIGDGMQQALEYGEMLDVPFIFSSNGDGFLFHNNIAAGKGETTEKVLDLQMFPSPRALWQQYCEWKGLAEDDDIILQDYHMGIMAKTPRYYQHIAINRTVEAITKGQQRILLVMATGTGKTFTAFQIIWRLWKAKKKKRILYLADRNFLIDQTMINDFKPFKNCMTKIKKRQVNKAYEIYMALYQAVTGSEEEKNIYRQFSPDFFDLVVVDECHRGSAAADSAWREVLEYFSSATQIGLTATPRETRTVSNIAYFGEAIYTYSLKQGILDGFLAPYKVVRIDLDKDLQGWRPTRGKRDKHGHLIEDRIYNQKDFDRNLVLEKRTEMVAEKVIAYMQETDPYGKAIIFCEDINHAERMRQAITNAAPELVRENRKFVMRITGDNKEGKDALDDFMNPEQRYPVIATTSKLLSAGADVQTCKLIVLDQRIQTLGEFKQIIGRGTRINEEFGKYYFTIMDFKKATELFADPKFDGEPEYVYDPGPGDPPVPPDEEFPPDEGDDDERVKKYYVHDVPVSIVAERVQYFGEDGKLVIESIKEYTCKAINAEYKSLNDFLNRWTAAEQKQVVIKELEEQGVFFEALAEEVGKDYDAFDLICHVAWDQPPLTRRERAENVRKKDYFTRYGEQARKVIETLLDKYADAGITNIEGFEILKLAPFNELGTPIEIVNSVGGKEEYEKLVKELSQAIYAA